VGDKNLAASRDGKPAPQVELKRRGETEAKLAGLDKAAAEIAGTLRGELAELNG
jgi:hypothetical protein